MAASVQQREQALLERLNAVSDPQQRLALLVEEACGRTPLKEEYKLEANKIEGCLSNLWFVANQEEGLCLFKSDSDSLIVRAIAGLLCDLYSGLPPAEVLQGDPGVLGRAGITQHLTQNRRNGLGRVWEKIRAFAEQQVGP